MSFTDDRRDTFSEFLSILDEEYAEFFADLGEELSYFDACGRFVVGDVLDDEGNFLPDIVVEAQKFAHTFPAYSDAALVYWENIDRLAVEQEER
ncbi:hypothetical protein [Lysinibacillus fusiformis]|uniref:hypothetical protein n=1 Tax=Lysinibacillus fusiformis TaxID=28031 RepID=UPI00301A4AD7